MKLCEKICFVCLVVFGFLLVLLGIVALTAIEGVINKAVLSRDHLGYENLNGTKRLNPMTEKWVHPEYDMQVQIWMINLTNAADVLRGHKPKIQEIGPFTFIERQYKSPYQFDKNDTRVFYRNNHVYFFNKSLSCGHCSLEQRVVIPNVVFQKLVDFALEQGPPAKLAIEAVLAVYKRETPFIEVSVKEALYDGYKDPLLDAVCGYSTFLRKLCEAAKIPDRIGFFYGQNNTDDGLYEVSTGFNDVFNISKVFSFNNMSVMPESVWDSAYAREIRGTDGQLFSPMLDEGPGLEIFAGQMCRSIEMQFLRRSVVGDIAAFRYGLPVKMFDPSIPQNRGFCNKNGTPTFFNTSIQIPGCLPKGLLDIGRCLPGTPRIYISNSHFFGASPEVISSIQGMDMPREENDQTFVDVEPLSGVPIHAKRVTQINVGMSKGNLNVLSNMNNMIFPVLWMNETVYFDNGTRNQLSQLISAKHLVRVVGVAVLTVGILVWFAVTAVVAVRTLTKPRDDDDQPILHEDVVEEEVGDI
nr:CD36 antigen domain containing protein [Haemonchus contortus]